MKRALDDDPGLAEKSIRNCQVISPPRGAELPFPIGNIGNLT
jgi:hypothetical protein